MCVRKACEGGLRRLGVQTIDFHEENVAALDVTLTADDLRLLKP
jgi:aryl-alcohol dehydrogenase-like predicted oxidoreductase